MAVARTIGPRVTQIVMYNDVSAGNIAAMITAVSSVDGTISIAAFPPNAATATHTGVPYDHRGVNVGSWHYHETDVI